MTRAYKNFKHNSNTRKRRSISPEYLAHKFLRGGGSLKTAYCDEDDDGVVASTFALKRSPAVYKGAKCEMVYDPPPEVGAVGISLEVLKPETGPVDAQLEIVKPQAGPVGFTLELYKPETGPVGVVLESIKPVEGPVGTSLDVIKPEIGPVGVTLAKNKPEIGPVGAKAQKLGPSISPVGILLNVVKPENGPVGTSLSALKPNNGPAGVELEVIKAAAGPVNISLENLKPQEGPVGITLVQSPAIGPVGVSVAESPPATGPVGTILFEYQQPVVSATDLHTIEWEPIDGVEGYNLYLYLWGTEYTLSSPGEAYNLDKHRASFMADAYNAHLITQDYTSRPGGEEGTWYHYRPDLYDLTQNRYRSHAILQSGNTGGYGQYGSEVTSVSTIGQVHGKDVGTYGQGDASGQIPFSLYRVGARYPDGYVSLSEPFIAFRITTENIITNFRNLLNDDYVKTHGYAYYDQYDTGVPHPTYSWMTIKENRIRGLITNTGMMKEIQVNSVGGDPIVTFPGSVTGLTETEHNANSTLATPTLHYSIREYLEAFWNFVPELSHTNSETNVTYTTTITQGVKDRVLAGMIYSDLDEKVFNVEMDDYVPQTLANTVD